MNCRYALYRAPVLIVSIGLRKEFIPAAGLCGNEVPELESPTGSGVDFSYDWTDRRADERVIEPGIFLRLRMH
jgi:hypothetical protein